MLELHDFLLDLGVRAERRGEMEAALELYAQAVVTQPDSALAWYNYGDVLLSKERYDEAVSCLRRAVELSPETSLFHYDLGLALLNLKQYEEACAEFAGIVANDPQLKRASSGLVMSAIANMALSEDLLGRPDKAARTLAPALRTAVDTLYNLGRFKLRAKRAAEAAELFQAAALLAPNSEEIIHGAGHALMDLNREPEAARFLVGATKLNPRCADAWYDLGLTWARLGKRKRARPCFIKVLRPDKSFAWA